jgi:tetratricopeptide (TPR) repeat protein
MSNPAASPASLHRLVLLAAVIFTSTMAAGQAAPSDGRGPPNPPRGSEREAMWPAPTAEDWKKPVLLTFQRTWADAVAVSKETGKPILVCINMDGEIASEHYAGVRYREPEIAKLYEPYVCVIASVYRHNPRDYDDEGKRILCPRFGSVTCDEHIWIEPTIYEKFCDGQRVAPRHIAVDLNGKETYDIYYRNDTASVFEDIRDRVPESKPTNIVRGDRPLLERVASRDVTDRTAVEEAYAKGNEELRSALLDAAIKHKQAEQLDLLRLAVFGLNVELSKQAREALTQMQSSDAADLIAEALRVPMDAAERDKLITALKAVGEKGSPRAKWVAGVHTGLAGSSTMVNVKGWTKGRAGGVYPAPDLTFGGFGRAGHVEDKTKALEEKPTDPTTAVELAEATLAQALKAPETYATNPRLARMAARHLYAAARRLAAEAAELGAPAWRTNTVLALASYYQGDKGKAYEISAEAVKEVPAGDRGWNSMAVVTIFAEGRWKAIKAAVRENRNWPSEWLTDLHAAYSLLLRHPLGTVSQVLWHYELLDWLGARYRSVQVLREGLDRFTTSPELHQRLRDRLLKYRGEKGLEAGYEQLLKEKNDPALYPFAGAASIAAANSYRRTSKYQHALDAYARAITYFEKAGNGPLMRRAIALARAGQSRVAYQLGDDQRALADILASFEGDPGAAGTRDDMGITPGETAQMLLARLREQGEAEATAKLEAAMAKLDPELLAPDIGLKGK